MNKKTLMKFAFACIILILVFVIAYSGLQILESAVLLVQQEDGVTPTKTISRDGVDYFPRQDITVVMMIGVDQRGEVKATAPNHADGADMVALMVIDEKAEKVSVLNLNRDTMLKMPALDENGRENGTFYGQLVYSRMYGTGLEDSCENTKKAVSKFLYGLKIDYYISVNMDAIPLLNDAVGGVTVMIQDDFSQVDPTMQKGVMTLHGDQALTFVQTRKNVGDQLNMSRLERQKEYMSNFVDVFRVKAEQSESFVLSTYEKILPYIVTDCSTTVLTSMMQRYSQYELAEIVSPEGENVLGEQYYEFYVDEEKLDDLILRLFYAPK